VSQTNTQEWYFMRGDQQGGPVPAARLKELATAGRLQPDDLVWKEGMAEWVPARTIKGLFPAGNVSPAASRTPAPASGRTPAPVEDAPVRRPSRRNTTFTFDGTAGSLFVTGLLAYLLMLVTCGIGFPWALCMFQRWKASHTLFQGRRLCFLGTGGDLFVLWLKLALLCAITLGIYTFWAIPVLHGWIIENTDFEEA
jgi:GYF domain 2/Bacterial protein of unknown function (DUF898)